VWVGQISRDIGIKLTTQSWYLTTHRISPEVDQDRFYLLQDLIMSGVVSRLGLVRGVGVSSMRDPRVNLTGDPYLTDSLRLVLFLNKPRQAFDQIAFLDWERTHQLSAAPAFVRYWEHSRHCLGIIARTCDVLKQLCVHTLV
jgi:hypothetical protein